MFTAFGAWVKIHIPGTPVPITLQTLFVLLGGAMLGIYGGLAQLIYVMLGSLGIPIFACGIGLLGPTGGYLIGFIVASTVVGAIIRHKSSFNWIIFSMIVGTGIIYLFGILQLGLFLPTGFKTVISLGILPFIPGDIAKLCIASIIYSKVGSHS
ncbi:MAG: biotin transporter BioY [Candidatus Stahlbacteria bacterium]|nr:biotin transporter BioY [Candidatus Stahlbacteria bacterium]